MRSTPVPALLAAAALTAGLLTSATTTSSAVASTRPAAAERPAAVAPGSPVTIEGRAAERGKVQLQRKAGRSWKGVAKRSTDRKRRYVFRFAAPAATTTYRVRAVRGGWVSRRTKVRVAAAVPPRGTLSAPSATQPETVLPVTATFAPARAGRPVVLQGRTGSGPWTQVAAGRQDAAGRTVLTVTPQATTEYRAVAAAWKGAGAVTSSSRTITVLPPREQPWVTGYYAGWFWDTGHYAPTDVNWDALTHIVLGRATPGGGEAFGGRPGDVVDAAGTFHDPSPWAPYAPGSVEDWMVDEAHRNGREALLMLGGDREAGGGFVASTADRVRPRFVENIVDHLVAHDYDGVDVDWENCLGGQALECGVDISEAEATRRLRALLLEIRAEMATRPRYAEDPGIITFPGYALNTNWLEPGGRAKQWQADVARSVDQFNLMSYGIGTTWNRDGWSSWFSGALDGESAEHPVSIDSSVEAYERTGVPRSRIGMGIGFFGVYYGPSVTGPRQDTETSDDGKPNTIYETDDVALSYAALDEMGYLDHGDQHWDGEASSTYISYGEDFGDDGYVPASDPEREPAGFLSFEDPRSIWAKGDYANETGLGGTIIWTLNYGALPGGSNLLLDYVGASFLGGPVP